MDHSFMCSGGLLVIVHLGTLKFPHHDSLPSQLEIVSLQIVSHNFMTAPPTLRKLKTIIRIILSFNLLIHSS